MATCPNGHVSEWDDYCSSCGAPIGAAAAAAPPDPAAPPASGAPDAAVAAVAPSAGEPCPACGEPRAVGAPFCEACGHDFAAPVPAPAPATAPGATGPTATGEALVAVVRADPAWFGAHGASSGLTFPDPAPPELRLPLTRDIVLIGRHSTSRGVFPDVDLSDLHDDPAVSHRHAELRRVAGGWVVVDLGSTNGTRVAPDGPTILPGTEVPVAAGAAVYLGAWTVIRLEPS